MNRSFHCSAIRRSTRMRGTTTTSTTLIARHLARSSPAQSLARSPCPRPHHIPPLTTQSRHHFHSSPTTMSSQKDWSASQYLKFERERTRPAKDLLSQIPVAAASPKRIIDIGCGPGNSTAILRTHFPDSHLTGIDSSPDMIAKARQTLPEIDFQLGDLQTYHPDPDSPVDILYSNAVYQWLPPDTRLDTLTRLLSTLKSGGVFAFQVPDNFDEPTHESMRAVAGSGKFSKLKDLQWGRVPFQSPAEIYKAFKPLCQDVNIWQTSYYHVLDDHDAIVEWVKGTGLRPYIDLLDDHERKEFMDMYLAKIREAYEPLYDGKVCLKYPRLFVVAVRA
ncbi:trans-aconitate 2-methyltransferase [Exophiala viscosa]|uniref:Trans-aconitate 2-methyltransferase n=1 Tax=Exophiala viscosa TaxID=2486360 RepID=A0AAN6DWH0_9EURO|nr:trans-aconitate 2-methyltransferase [Exophiala viscosa]